MSWYLLIQNSIVLKINAHVFFCCRSIYVLYGSQTGNSEHIAKDLYDKLLELGLPCKCQTLNTIKKVDLRNDASCLVIVCSTTGNGDAPENAELWWRSIKLRSAVCFFHSN